MQNKQPLIVGNLKMTIDTDAALGRYRSSLTAALKRKGNLSDAHVVLCPPIVHLKEFRKMLADTSIALGAQDASPGVTTLTGGVSTRMLASYGVSYVIVGHSERRTLLEESDELVNAKLHAVLAQKMQPILCVGETRDERDAGFFAKVIVEQLRTGLADVPHALISRIVIAYEPVWAVGTDEVPESNAVLSAKVIIRRTLMELYGAHAPERMRILYGGSVTQKTCDALCRAPQMDGLLIGRKSLTPSLFFDIIKTAAV